MNAGKSQRRGWRCAMRTVPAGALAAMLVTLGACTTQVPSSREVHTDRPVGATIEPSGFATVLHAPPSAAPVPGPPRIESEPERVARERGIPVADAERLMNPDEAAHEAAMALNRRLKAQDAGNYVGVRIVRDPEPRFAFQFRRDAAATLARFTSDPRFVAREGGLTREELQPLFDAWWKRFEPHRILGGGSVMEFDGNVRFDMTIDEAAYRAIAAREGWVPPPQVRLHFPPPPNPRSVDPALAPLVRVFAREDRSPGVVLNALLGGRLVLRDGCFRIQDHGDGDGDGEPLVLFGRDVELRLDEDGYLIVVDPRDSDAFGGPAARVGERVVWSGPRGVHEADEGAKALRAACGPGPVVAIGEPEGARRFETRWPPGP
ncbi:hypothetical protein LDO32_09930 [Luteimonas sp. Y-2-2-4F]|nr:hypothetical protein [Luteimonas sp. Y-2-2-4F]MCD9032039.1 hypothetical protein [Luteimonas sp. Y-2-2-4F]